MATDPVCGMFVDDRTAELRLIRENRTYLFCSQTCLEAFAAPGRHLAALKRRLAVAWPAAVIVLFLTYGPHIWGANDISLGLATVVQFYSGLPFYRGTLDALRSRIGNMDVLIATGTSAAYAYSAAVLLLPGRLPSGLYFDASTFIITLILTGNYLEHLTRDRARGTLQRLQEQLPAAARVVRDGVETTIPVGEVRTGDTVRVAAGGRFPVDGEVLSGRSTVVEALLTGESLPRSKRTGDPVVAGTVNGEGALEIRAGRVGSDTLLAQIGQLVSEAETSRVPLQRTADRVASGFVPAVLAFGFLAATGWGLGGAGFTHALLVFVTVVITACPCAFGIATPAAIVVGTGRAAEEGIVFKGRDSIEKASRVDIVLTDKTGTLTEGTPRLIAAVPAPPHTESELLELASGVELGSAHPLAKAVREAAVLRGITPKVFAELTVVPGRGVQGRDQEGLVSIESLEGPTPESLGVSLSSVVRGLVERGATVSVCWREDEPIGILGFEDTVAPGGAEAVESLRRQGIRVVMVTGDGETAARSVARATGIEEVHSGLDPAGKLALLRKYRNDGYVVAFVGDGMNDAPALTAADVGVAIGAGSDVAREAGGVVLVSSQFSGVGEALRISRRTVRKVRQNIFWALGYNAVLLPVAAGALVPAFGFAVYAVLPILGALAMGLSSTTVVLNSLSLRR